MPLTGERFSEEPVSRINFDADFLDGAAAESPRQEFDPMPENPKFKKLVRARMERTEESYAQARDALLGERGREQSAEMSRVANNSDPVMSEGARLLADFDRVAAEVEAMIRRSPVKKVEKEGDGIVLIGFADYAFRDLDTEGRRTQVRLLGLFRPWFVRFKAFLEDLPEHQAKELENTASHLSKAWIEHASQCWGLAASPDASIRALREEVRPIREAIEPFVDVEAPPTSGPESTGRRFRVALSFAGEQRKFVDPLARLLARQFGEHGVLYDKFHEAEFARADLGVYLPKLYNEQSDLVVVIACPNYNVKEWTGLEWSAIHDLIQQRRPGEVMLCRFDRAQVDGLYRGAGWVELDGRTPADAENLIHKRLAVNEGRATEVASPAPPPAPSPRPPDLPAPALEVFRAFLDKKGAHDFVLLEHFHREVAPAFGERRFQLGVEQAKAAGLLRPGQGISPTLYLDEGGRRLLLEHPETIDDPPEPAPARKKVPPPRVKVLGRGFHTGETWVGSAWWVTDGDEAELMASLWADAKDDVFRGNHGGTLIARIAKDLPDHHSWAANSIVSTDYVGQGRARSLDSAKDQVLESLDKIVPGIRGLLLDKPPPKITVKSRFSN